jgi:unspecific monooxygenase
MVRQADVPISPIDITLPDFGHDLIDNYEHIRRSGRVVYVPGARAYMISGFGDVAAAMHNARLVVMDYEIGWRRAAENFGRDYSPIFRLFSYMPFAHEGRLHTKLRTVMAQGLASFSGGHPHFNASVAAKIAQLRRDGGGDLAQDLSRYLLFDMMCDLMQVPAADRAALRPIANMAFGAEATISLRKRDRVNAQVRLCLDYLSAHAAATLGKSNPGFITDLFKGLPPDIDNKFEAIAAFATLAFLMGNDALGACISMGVQRILDPSQPGPPQAQWGTLAGDVIRYAAPVDNIVRRAAEDTEVGGCPIARGQSVILPMIAANHDSAKYGARHAAIARHDDVGLAFGTGRHACVGRRLSLTVAKIVLEALAALPPMRLKGGAVHGTGRLVRTLESLPVELV